MKIKRIDKMDNNKCREKLHDFKEILIVTFIIGLIAHGFCYLNFNYGHDGAALWWKSSIVGSAGGGRFLQPLLHMFLYDVHVPWLDGVLTLSFYSVAAWSICETLMIKNRVLRYLIAGVLITSPTAIASNHYTGYVFAFTLMTACLAVYAFTCVRFGGIWGFVLVFITAGVYASYVSVTVVVFLLYSIRQVLMNGNKKFLRQVEMAVIAFVAMLSVLVLSMKIAEVNDVEVQARVESATEITETSEVSLFDLIREAVDEVITFFSPQSDISFFQGMPVVYFSFWLLFLGSVLGLIYLMIYRFKQEKCAHMDNRKMFTSFGIEVAIILVDILCLPLAMNMLAIVTVCHYLMTFAFITPWIMAILVLDMIIEIQGERNIGLLLGYKSVIVLACSITICEGIKLANISYTKQYSNYETGIQYANRVVSRIESVDGYEEGKTQVLFIGYEMNTYSNEDSGYKILDDLTGISGDTALTYSDPMLYYIQQRLGVNMNIITSDNGFSIEECVSTLRNRNVYFDIEEICNLNAFPQNNCYLWADDILVFKLDDSSEYDIESDDNVVMECWPEQGDYELVDTIQYYLDIPLGISRIVMDVSNGGNIALDVLDSDDVQNVKITKRDNNQIYIDILSSQDTNITFQVGLNSQEELTTIHRIAIRPITNYYELTVSEKNKIELNEGSYLFTIEGECMSDVNIEWDGDNITIEETQVSDNQIQVLVTVPKNEQITYNVETGILNISKITYKIMIQSDD